MFIIFYRNIISILCVACAVTAILFGAHAEGDTIPKEAALGSLADSQNGVSGAPSVPSSINLPIVEDTKDVNDRKEYLVVSRNPEFFNYTLTGISILLTVMTILLGVTTGIGLTVVLKVGKERKELEGMRKSITEEKEQITQQLQTDYNILLEAMKKTVYGLATLQNAKTEIERILDDGGDKGLLYKLIEKTVIHTDHDCVRLYGKILQQYEADIDIVRLVRNGLLQFRGC